MGTIIIVSFVIYFVLQLLYTQIIYSRNYFVLSLTTTLLLPVIYLLFVSQANIIVIVNAGLLSFYFIILLLAVKWGYKKTNKQLIHKGFIDLRSANKDFTYVLWDGDIPTAGSWFDKKLASKPSWLDHLFTYLLIVIPIIIFWFINLLTAG